MYEYVKKTYGVNPVLDQTVVHTENNQTGKIVRENRSLKKYVMVLFSGRRHPVPCHPTALDYRPHD